jgi:acetylornithine/succinyldiaminopimelate/putrescine aminotransferase
VLLESIPATSGFPLPAPGYLAGVQERCAASGTLLALDEVQTGLGRTAGCGPTSTTMSSPTW